MQSLPKSQLPIIGSLSSSIPSPSKHLAGLKSSFKDLKALQAKLKAATTIDAVHKTSEAINRSLVAFSFKTNSFIKTCLTPV